MRLGVAVAVSVLIAACNGDGGQGPPSLGASVGDVHLTPEGKLTSGEAASVRITANRPDEVVASLCLRLYRYDGDGFGPEVDWLINGRSGEVSRINSTEVSCPAMGVTLPTSFAFTMPDLDGGTYRLVFDCQRVDATDSSVGGCSADYTFATQ